jgi:hypothetical protein
VTPFPVAFGMVAAGMTVTIQVTLTNASGGQLVLSALSIDGANALDFASPNAPMLPLSLAAGQSVALSLQFSPAAPGRETAELSITTDNASCPSLKVPITGN